MRVSTPRTLLAGTAAAPHDELADIMRILASPDGADHLEAAQHTTGILEPPCGR
ncbi:hypothetical protein [Streptomyces sp. SAI-163]|uniref:hypothetical protein n=1 Tax=Streptomyces sp. SAI-163 TaxID=3377735 RepID=UPI003C7EBD3F